MKCDLGYAKYKQNALLLEKHIEGFCPEGHISVLSQSLTSYQLIIWISEQEKMINYKVKTKNHSDAIKPCAI